MSEYSADETPPHTGLDVIDRALAALDLSGDVAGHPGALASVQDVLQAVLNATVEDSSAR